MPFSAKCEMRNALNARNLKVLNSYHLLVVPLRTRSPSAAAYCPDNSRTLFARSSPAVRTLWTAAGCYNLFHINTSRTIQRNVFERMPTTLYSRISAKSPCGLDGVAGTLFALRLLGLVLLARCCCRSAFRFSVRISRSVRPE